METSCDDQFGRSCEVFLKRNSFIIFFFDSLNSISLAIKYGFYFKVLDFDIYVKKKWWKCVWVSSSVVTASSIETKNKIRVERYFWIPMNFQVMLWIISNRYWWRFLKADCRYSMRTRGDWQWMLEYKSKNSHKITLSSKCCTKLASSWMRWHFSISLRFSQTRIPTKQLQYIFSNIFFL